MRRPAEAWEPGGAALEPRMRSPMRVQSPTRLSSAPQGCMCSDAKLAQMVTSPLRGSMSLTQIGFLRDQGSAPPEVDTLRRSPSPTQQHGVLCAPPTEAGSATARTSPRGRAPPPPTAPATSCCTVVRQSSPVRMGSAPQCNAIPGLRSASPAATVQQPQAPAGQQPQAPPAPLRAQRSVSPAPPVQQAPAPTAPVPAPRSASPAPSMQPPPLATTPLPLAAPSAWQEPAGMDLHARSVSPFRPAAVPPLAAESGIVSPRHPGPTRSPVSRRRGLLPTGFPEGLPSAGQSIPAVRPPSPMSARSSSPQISSRAGLLNCASVGRLGLGNCVGPGGAGPLLSGSGLFRRCPSSEGLAASPRQQQPGHSSVPAPTLAPDPVSELSLPPFFYEADPTDAMDVALLQELVALNLEVSARLNIKRLKPGEYEIEGVRVSLYWQTGELYVRARRPGRKRGRRGRRRSSSVPAGEEDASSQDGPSETPLTAYLRELANVDSRKLAFLDPQIDAAVAAAAFAGATASGVGLTPLQSHPAPSPAWPGPPNVGSGVQLTRPPVGPFGA
eukprot:CAMPEP_0179018296 /NCGR_PEP_ID=MMETSP0796-20121207/4281_1 /TAXON_ID=73915 /ORGANISM="Pyrodinium bahamense, Strain pbaha01" /LENGTH=556 /DNA_ID=CAMNT_0020714051 /DNA_START=1 /DNA_END=1667 /DNA_ORIENTATION=+